MSRNTGQVSTRHALLGMSAVLGACAVIVAMCEWLLLPAEQLPSLANLSQSELDLPAEATCDDRLRALRRRSTSRALRVDSATLIECPDTFDGRAVEYRGEAVSAVLRRGDRAWLQMNDDVYALSAGPLPEHRQSLGGNAGVAVNVPAATADAITAVGGAHHRGDVLTVHGVFRSAAPDDGGGPSILAARAVRTRPGGAVSSPRSGRRMTVALLLLMITIVGAVRARST
jgi:hypothetical protein